MQDAIFRFRDLLERTLIPEFCSNPARNMSPSGFCGNFALLSEIDAMDFLRGWDARLLKHEGGGRYRASNSGAMTQFFWSGRKANSPRTFTLWIEPIITLGVLARMHLDFGWPKTLIGAETKSDWAFDAFGRNSEDNSGLLVACEVKKSFNEVDALINHMRRFGRRLPLPDEHLKSPENSALKKVKALRTLKPKLFWAVGPNRYEKLFSVQYLGDDVVDFEPDSSDALLCMA